MGISHFSVSKKIPANILTGRITTGIYKGHEFELVIGKVPQKHRITIGNKQIENCTGIWIKLMPDELPRITIELIPRK